MEIKINEQEYKIPNYINIDTYVKLYNIKDLFDDEYYEIKLISLMTGAKTDDILKLPHSKIKIVSNYILSILPTTNFVFHDSFTLNDIEYGFIPEYKNMSFGEFVDLDTLLTKKPDEIMNQLHIISSIMFRPIISKKSKHNYKIEEYNSETIEERAELFKKELDVKYVLGGKFFFSESVRTSSIYIQPFSIKRKLNIWLKILKLFWKLKTTFRSRKRSDGSLLSTELLETILQNTNKLQKKEQ
jgi:hypothetical protein